MKIEHTVNGRPASLDEVVDELSRRAADTIALELERRAGRVRCPTHGAPPTLARAERRGGRNGLAIQGCCDELVGLVERQLGLRPWPGGPLRAAGRKDGR